jgi:hypoxanthine phosphoribosyltransferase
MPPDAKPAWKGLDTSVIPRFISYDQAERMLAALMDEAAAWQPDAVVAVLRGGLIPATMAATMLALPLHMIAWDRATNSVAWHGPAAAGRLLVVDDSASTGTTLKSILAALAPQPTRSLTIVHDPSVSAFAPDLSHPMTDLFRLPWERGEATPAARAARAEGRHSRAAEAPFTGLDLDGVFLPDLPPATYEADLQAAIAARHALPPLPALPAFAPTRAVIITGRPQADEHLTRAWLDRHGHAAIPLVSRPADVAHDIASVTAYKARAATSWGCTHYIESDPEQAIRIAANAPHLVVSWWSAADTRAWVVGAA